MAQYTPSFVNLSGASQAIGNSLVQAAKMRYQQDQMVQSQLDDFEKNYNTEKLRNQDLATFTSAFKNYKEAALNYSRLNRSGSSPDEIATANVMKDRALNEMNSIYSKSASANQLLKERSEYRKLMAQKGYSTTDDVNNEIMQLSTNDVNNINLSSFTSPYDKPIYANGDDYKYLYASLKGARITQDNIEDESKSKEIDIDGYGKVKIPYMVAVTGSNIQDAITLTANALKAKPALNNTAVREYGEFMQKLAIPETETDPVLASDREIAKKKYNDIMAATGNKFSFSPELLMASNTPAFSQGTKDIGLDKKYHDMIQTELKRRLSGQRLAMAQKSLGLQFSKFGYLQDKDMQKLYLTPGAENIPSVAESAAKNNINLGDVRNSQVKHALAKKKKRGNISSFFENIQKQQ